jgi:PKD repeat protein
MTVQFPSRRIRGSTRSLPWLLLLAVLTSGSVGALRVVPAELAERVALEFADRVFDRYSLGDVRTYEDIMGNPAVYVFTFDLTGRGFPAEAGILQRVEAGAETWERAKRTQDRALEIQGQRQMVGEADFGMIMVSATDDRGPVIEFYEGLPLHFVLDARSKRVAEDHLGGSAELSRYVYFSPFDIWAEYARDQRIVLVSTRDLSVTEENVVRSLGRLEVKEDVAEQIGRDWERIRGGRSFPDSRAEFRIPGVPDHDWSYGCSPTASANILDYWDSNGYSLLTDYYFDRWDGIEGEWDHDLPNCQQQLAIAMDTDTISTGGTYLGDIAPGTEAVCNSPTWGNGYDFNSWSAGDNHTLLINELEDYHPTHWAVINHPTYYDHSITAMGWGPPNDGYICIHDTWSYTPEEVVIDYDNWGGSRYVIPVVPGGGEPPTADFSADPLIGNAPLDVQFTDETSGAADSWIWEFGDGDTSHQRHPLHTYTGIGDYDVTLTVSGPGGGDSETKYDYISVVGNPDSAWLSFDPGGYPKLESAGLSVSDTAEFSMILKSASDTAHSVMYPLYYDHHEMELVELVMDSSTFPTPAAWNFFENSTIENDSGKVMLYAWTSAYVFGVAPGVNRIGTVALRALDVAETGIDTCFYPPQGHLYYSNGISGEDYWPYWTPVDVTITEPNPDSAWLSLDSSGYPKLMELSAYGGETVELSMMLKNASDTAHSVMYPVTYDTACFGLETLEFDTATFPLTPVWTFFVRDTVVGDSGKVLLYAYTSVFAYGIPDGVNRIGVLELSSVTPSGDSSMCVLDTCFYAPSGHLYYTDGVTAVDYWPDWVPVAATVYAGLCGDANGDGSVTSGDGFMILNYFGSGPQPASCWASNVNGDGSLTTGDGFHLLNYLGAGPALNCAPCSF